MVLVYNFCLLTFSMPHFHHTLLYSFHHGFISSANTVLIATSRLFLINVTPGHSQKQVLLPASPPHTHTPTSSVWLIRSCFFSCLIIFFWKLDIYCNNSGYWFPQLWSFCYLLVCLLIDWLDYFSKVCFSSRMLSLQYCSLDMFPVTWGDWFWQSSLPFFP